jgi:hypothetical protein
MVIVSFFGLVITGTPLLYSHMPWARTMIRLVGGFQAAGLIHRICAVITFAYFFIHVGHLTYRIAKSADKKRFFWGPDSMVGQAVIGGSGLVLWFPVFFSKILPGWIFNVATIVHGIEALLATGMIFTIHFFNVNLRPEKFPVDVVMFTGRATLDYMKEEHPLQYERLAREGRIEEMIAPPPSRAAYLWSVSLGLIALSLGILLIGLIIWALIQGGWR